jgi:BirA family biotin operon repressor/biotin-[acetyl-CoA-carboxylase] ligase
MTSLDADQIREPFSAMPRARLDHLEIFAEIESTNCYLLDQPAPPPGRFRVALAEHQTAGRGRMDKVWHSPPSSGLCMSMSYTFEQAPENLPCVTLAIGVALAKSLEQIGLSGVGLKWPNDIVVRNGKLGGILTEVRSAHGQGMTVVVGVGINVDLGCTPETSGILTSIGYASDLATCLDDLPSRSAISAAMIEGLFNALAEFETDGFSPFFKAWERFDWLRGQRVSVDQSDGLIRGVCQGIDVDGALILRTDSGTQRILSGSVQLHGQQAAN